MKKILIYFVLISLATAAQTKPLSAPLSLEWGKEHKHHPELKKYKYYYGDIQWGKIIYIGLEDIAGMETELHLKFHSKKIASVSLLLGPQGLNEHNCFKKYKRVVKIFNYKYGKYNFRRVTKDPIIEDLIHLSVCTPVLAGVYDIDTVWSTPDYQIVASMFGDEEGVYIEIEYTNLSRAKKHKQSKLVEISKDI